MTIPIQLGWQQLLLVLIAILGVGLFISSLMGLVVRFREMELLEDEHGNTYRHYRHRRGLRWKRGVSGLVLLLLAFFILWVTFAVQSYLSLTGDIKVARVHATQVANESHTMNVELILYDQNGKQTSDQTYAVKGDRWLLQGDIVEFPAWFNFFGVHSGYKLTRLEGQFDDPNLESSSRHTVVPLNGGDDDFFNAARKNALPFPFAKGYYGSAVIVPANGTTYNVYASQTGLKAEPTS